MVVVLFVICTTSGVVLSYVNEATEEPREYSYIKFVQEPSMKAVLSDYDNDPIKERIKLAVGEDEEGNPVEVVVFPAKKGGKTEADEPGNQKDKLDAPFANSNDFLNSSKANPLKQSAAAELGITVEKLDRMPVEEIKQLAQKKGLI